MGVRNVCQDKADDIDEPSTDAIDRKERHILETVMQMNATTCWSRGIEGATTAINALCEGGGRPVPSNHLGEVRALMPPGRSNGRVGKYCVLTT